MILVRVSSMKSVRPVNHGSGKVQQRLSPSRQWRVPRKSREFRKLEASVPQRSEELAVHGQLLQMLLPNRLLLNQSEAKELQADLSDRLLMLSPRPE